MVDGLGRVWILGGYVQGGATNLDAWIYDVGLGSWSQAADGPQAIADHSAIYEPTGSGKNLDPCRLEWTSFSYLKGLGSVKSPDM